MSQFLLVFVSITYTFISSCFIVHCNSNSFTFFCRMEQFHLLDLTYEATHRGRLIALGQVIIYKFCSKFGECTCVHEVTGDYVLFDAGPSAPSS